MSGITASLRSRGKLSTDLRKTDLDLKSFLRLQFLAIVQAFPEVTDQMWTSRKFLANVTPEGGKYLSASCNCRCNLATQQVNLGTDQRFICIRNRWIGRKVKGPDKMTKKQMY